MTLIHPLDRHDLIAPADVPAHLAKDHHVTLPAFSDGLYITSLTYAAARGIDLTDVSDYEAICLVLHERDHEVRERELTADEAEAAGLDPTGRDGDPRFPYTALDLEGAR